MTELKTKPSLLTALESAAKHAHTADELHTQRISFVMASVSEKGGVTRSRVEEVLAQQEGLRVAK